MSYSSIKGAILGYDMRDKGIVARYGTKANVSAPSTSVTVEGWGVSVDPSTGAKSYTLAAPVTGNRKTLVLNSTSTSTAARTFTLASGNFQSTASSTYTSVTLNGSGQIADLVAISTARYQVLALSGAGVLA